MLILIIFYVLYSYIIITHTHIFFLEFLVDSMLKICDILKYNKIKMCFLKQ